MTSTAGQQGVALAEAKDFAAALPKLNEALKSSSSPTWLLARSKCHIGLRQYPAALRDAEAAYRSATSRGSRPLMTEAQYRRTVALFRLGRTADADMCAYWSMKLAEGVPIGDPIFTDEAAPEDLQDGFWRPDRDAVQKRLRDVMMPVDRSQMPKEPFGPLWKTAATLRTQTIAKLDQLGPEDEARKITVKFEPPEVDPEDPDAEEDELLRQAVAEKIQVEEEAQKPQPQPAQPPKPVRVDFFQTNTNVTVSVFVKSVPKDLFQYEITSDKVRLSHIPGHEGFYEIFLFGHVDPAQSKCAVTPNKVELNLRKTESIKWPTLRRNRDSEASGAAPTPAAAAPTNASASASAPAPAASLPAYPTSSRKGPKNWEKLLSEDEEDVDYEKEGVNDFFKSLYAGATDEQRRAMIKSFTESNGTSLSTNWDDVKEKKVETVPPEGVEVRKWEE
ncbi:SGS-domain-containing protein [Sodiomyces alkalinus F11]|uniref:SGS-domain-containing protein n=1 Tax=Sodiomyces alkalinus (strain CBS 110278 / VKM F-3762 / F11) TaxID=1314773 RepID=A0A3N2PX12_SODAK|nr:SGS-domain-containing protein [Sodiomyces alkalinus F11]ROT39022.1 SGS-domain-containing protein [Sodiomyces alkalinus F11]